MADIVHCNKEQAEKILETYFAHKPVITRVSKDDEDGIYFITAKTVTGMLRTEWQYRGTVTNGGACFGEVHKGNRRYDLSYGYSEELMKPLNDACRKAIENYEKGCDLFLNEEVQEIKAAGENIKQVIKSSDKKAYILCGILLIALIIKFIIG